MNGANPFIDILTIIDRNFDPEMVEYLPASSSILDSSDVIQEWYSNFLEENEDVRNVLLLDEVVSGSSVVKLHKNISRAEKTINLTRQSRDISTLLQKLVEEPAEGVQYLDQYLTQNGSDDKRLISNLYESLPQLLQNPYYFSTDEGRRTLQTLSENLKRAFPAARHHVIGLEDEKILKRRRERHKSYRKLRDAGIVTGIPVLRIITMDNPLLNSVRYQEARGLSGYCRYLPRVEKLVLTQEYLALLQDVARMVGVDPDTVGITNPSRIMKAHGYLSPERYCSPRR